MTRGKISRNPLPFILSISYFYKPPILRFFAPIENHSGPYLRDAGLSLRNRLISLPGHLRPRLSGRQVIWSLGARKKDHLKRNYTTDEHSLNEQPCPEL